MKKLILILSLLLLGCHKYPNYSMCKCVNKWDKIAQETQHHMDTEWNREKVGKWDWINETLKNE